MQRKLFQVEFIEFEGDFVNNSFVETLRTYGCSGEETREKKVMIEIGRSNAIHYKMENVIIASPIANSKPQPKLRDFNFGNRLKNERISL